MRELFAQDPVEIIVGGIRGDQVKVGLTGDRRFRILREELCPEPTTAPAIPCTATR